MLVAVLHGISNKKKKPTVLFCVAKSAARLVDESCLPDGYNIHKTLFVIAKIHAR